MRVNQAVGADRSGVDLVVDQVVQLQHVDVAHRDLAVEDLAGASVDQGDLARAVQPGLLQHRRDILLAGAVEDLPEERHGRRSEEHTSELQSLMRISYAVFCLTKKKK